MTLLRQYRDSPPYQEMSSMYFIEIICNILLWQYLYNFFIYEEHLLVEVKKFSKCYFVCKTGGRYSNCRKSYYIVI